MSALSPQLLLAASAPPEGAAVRFTLALGEALHRYGTPAHRLEDAMQRVSARLGMEGRFFSSPTAIFASFGPPEAQRTCLVRVEPGDVDLDRLSRLDALVEAVARGERGLEHGAAELDAILAAPPPHGVPLTLLCFAVVATCWGRLFGGGVREMAVAAVASFLVGGLSVGAERVGALGRVLVPLAAVLASAVAVLCAHVAGPLSVQVATLAGLIVLLPGLSLTTAVNELATRNLMSGTSRLVGTAVDFLKLGFGVELGGRLALLLPPTAGPSVGPSLAGWTELVVLPLGMLAMGVIFRARRSDAGWVVLAGVVAYGAARLGAVVLGTQLGAFVGALALGVASNAFARLRGRPALITLVPGIILLVPGSVGFRSLESLLAKDTVAGVDTAFSMALVSVSLVAGLLVANAVMPSRRAL